MKKYKSETEKAVLLAQAQCAIQEFLKHSYSYADLMTMTAKAQAQVFNILNMVGPDEREQCTVENVAEFFYFAIQAFELLKPFSEDETGAV